MLNLGTRVKVTGQRSDSSYVARIHDTQSGVVVFDTEGVLTPPSARIISLVDIDGFGLAFIPDRDLDPTGEI